MNGILNEQRLDLKEVPPLVPGRAGRPVSPATVYRWATKGLNGARLQTVQVGSRMVTSREAIDRFFAELTAIRAAQLGEPSPVMRRGRKPAKASL
jgi:Protein of unknown function (DUF1580)